MPIARTSPLIYTCLAPTRFAEIAGITPPHFWGAAGNNYFPVSFDVNDTSTIAAHKFNTSCDQLFFHWAWQAGDRVGRWDISQAIHNAEEDVENILGYPLCRKWVEGEIHTYPQHYRKDVYPVGMLNVRGQHKAVRLKKGKFIQGGRRSTAEVTSSVAVVYSDEDGDGYDETATIATATTLTDACEIKVYFAGQGGVKEWEIRRPRSVVLSGGTITFVFDAWLLLDPDLQNVYPRTGGVSPINLETVGNYETTVDVFREFNDFTQASAQLFWEPQPIANAAIVGLGCSQCGGSGCVACSLTAQDGCIHVRDTDLGLIVPQPATYNTTTGQWDPVNPTVCRDPDQVKFWYYAGELSNRFLSGFECDPLSQYWAETIAWLATARLRRELCDCGPAKAFSKELQTDLAFAGRAGRHQVNFSDLDNPFGTMVGEIKAWRRVAKLTDSILVGAGAV